MKWNKILEYSWITICTVRQFLLPFVKWVLWNNQPIIKAVHKSHYNFKVRHACVKLWKMSNELQYEQLVYKYSEGQKKRRIFHIMDFVPLVYFDSAFITWWLKNMIRGFNCQKFHCFWTMNSSAKRSIESTLHNETNDSKFKFLTSGKHQQYRYLCILHMVEVDSLNKIQRNHTVE